MNKNWQKKAVVFFLFMSMLAPFNRSSLLFGQWDCQDVQRNRVAMGLAGITAVGLAVGIVVLGCNNENCKKHCSHHHCGSSSYSSCYSDYSYYSDYSDYTYSDYSHHHHSHHHHNSVSSHFPSSYYEDIGRNMRSEDGLAVKNDVLSGVFALDFKGVSQVHGSITPYIQFPDGTTEILDTMDLSDTAASVSFGPLKQMGNYEFGIRINQGAVFSAEEADMLVNICRNGSVVQTSGFSLNPPANFSPSPIFFKFI